MALLTCILLTGLDVSAAKLIVRDMKLLPTDQTAINPETMRKDQNGKTAALIKLYTPNINEIETFFDNGTMGIVGGIEKKPGEIWIYIPSRSQHLQITNQRYEPYEWWFEEEIKPGKVYSAILTVEGKDVTLSASVRQAPIFVDGELIGGSPQTVYLSYGEHYITARQDPMYGEVTAVVTPESPRRIEIPMEDQNLKYSDVTVTSPDGAEIWFEGKSAGLGVFKTRLETGDYTVEFRKPNHEDGLVKFHATAGQPTEVKGPTLLPYRGFLSVTVNPTTGTRILSGDTLVAEHRLERQLGVGNHIFTFRKKGYLPQMRTFTVSRNEETVDTVNLERIQYVRSNALHGSLGFTYGTIPGVSVNLGATYMNIDLDFGYTIGMGRTDEVYWKETSSGLYKGVTDYAMDEISIKAGYQLSFVERIGLTPQLGYLGQRLRGGEWGNGAMCHNLSIGARLVFNPHPNIGIFLTPEYAVPIMVNQLYSDIANDAGITKGGFYIGAGVIFNVKL